MDKSQILAAEDLKTEVVPVPEWGGDVIISEMTSEARDEFEMGLFDGEGKEKKFNQANLRARLVSYCLIDAAGARVFDSPDDVKALGRKNSRVVSDLFDRAQRLNGMDKEAKETAKKT